MHNVARNTNIDEDKIKLLHCKIELSCRWLGETEKEQSLREFIEFMRTSNYRGKRVFGVVFSGFKHLVFHTCDAEEELSSLLWQILETKYDSSKFALTESEKIGMILIEANKEFLCNNFEVAAGLYEKRSEKLLLMHGSSKKTAGYRELIICYLHLGRNEEAVQYWRRFQRTINLYPRNNEDTCRMLFGNDELFDKLQEFDAKMGKLDRIPTVKKCSHRPCQKVIKIDYCFKIVNSSVHAYTYDARYLGESPFWLIFIQTEKKSFCYVFFSNKFLTFFIFTRFPLYMKLIFGQYQNPTLF